LGDISFVLNKYMKGEQSVSLMDLTMLLLPIISFAIGWFKYRLNETNNFTYGFFCGSLIALTIYAQTSDSGLSWLKV